MYSGSAFSQEKVYALDVVVQRQIMQTLRSLQEELGATVLLVGHDMGLMAQSAERLGIMYGGRLVEVGPTDAIFRDPKHPYTRLLISSIPSFRTRGAFRGIPGVTLSLLDPPSGCLFHPRCPEATQRCARMTPRLLPVGPAQQAACLLYDEENHGAPA